MNEKIKKGDKIRIVQAFQDAGDEKFSWLAASDEVDGVLDITTTYAIEHFSLVPIQRVKSYMVEKA